MRDQVVDVLAQQVDFDLAGFHLAESARGFVDLFVTTRTGSMMVCASVRLLKMLPFGLSILILFLVSAQRMLPSSS